ncbi:MAG: transglutaminase-like domain-containing protein [Chloroflexota bacterium]|nr:transglutaminase-like domain-containing protein [Chloroflexota bacterium]
MITRLMQLLHRHLDRKTLRTWALILLLFAGMVSALGGAVRGVENILLWIMISSGLLVGWLLTCTPLSARAATIISGIVGIGLLLVRVGRLGIILRAIFYQILVFITQTALWLFAGSDRPDYLPIKWGLIELWDGVSALAQRLWIWISNLLHDQPLFDPAAIAVLWGFIIWVTAVWAIWKIFRDKKPLQGIIPAITLVAISLVYVQKSPYALVLMLGAGVSLIIFVRHDQRVNLWEQDNLAYSSVIQSKISTTAILLMLGLMVFSAITPSISIRHIANHIRNLAEGRVNDQDIARSLGLEPRPGTESVDVLDTRQSGGLPNQHLIGSEEELSDRVVMVVQVEEMGQESRDDDDDAPIYYWRNLTYDLYVGRGWSSRDSIDQDYAAGKQTLPTWPENYSVVRQQVQVVEDLGGLMHTIGIPLSADHDFKVAWRVRDNDLGAYDIFGATVAGKTYRADSLLVDYSESELRAAGQDYPNWVLNRYTNLPPSVPERVLALARDLTATEPTPYDRALTIEHYLRKIPYSLDIPMPPIDRDISEYFLFVIQEGYCDYYATSMVVLARAAGLPARFVTGYIGGYFDETEDAYRITADQAHAWPEVYFPEYGWIVFEPTGGRPGIDRPPKPFSKISQDFDASFDPLVPNKTFPTGKWLQIAGLFFVSFIGAGLTWWGISDWRLPQIPSRDLVPKLYLRVYRYARWIGISTKPGNTPYEFTRALTEIFHQLGHDSKWADWILAGINQLDALTEVYYLATYSPLRDNPGYARDIAQTYKQLRSRLWLLWFLKVSHPNRILRYFFWG